MTTPFDPSTDTRAVPRSLEGRTAGDHLASDPGGDGSRRSVVRRLRGELLARNPQWPVGPPAVQWGIAVALGCFLAAQLLSQFWALGALTVVFDGSVPDPFPIWAIGVTNAGLWIGYLAGPAIVSRLLGRGFRRDFELRGSMLEYGLAAAVGVGSQLLLLPALYWVLDDLIDGDPGQFARDLVLRADSVADVAVLVFSVAIAAPLVEEVMFRGLLLPAAVGRLGLVAGIAASSLVFALVHPDPVTYPGLFLFAVILSWLTAASGRLGSAVVAHAAFNLTTIVGLMTGWWG